MTVSNKPRSRTKTAVHFFLKGGFLVRGTLDPHTALAMAVDDEESHKIGYACEMATRPDGDTDQPSPDEVGDLGDLLHGYLANANPGLYRIVPARPDEDEYSWYMHGARERGPGVFEGVVFW